MFYSLLVLTIWFLKNIVDIHNWKKKSKNKCIVHKTFFNLWISQIFWQLAPKSCKFMNNMRKKLKTSHNKCPLKITYIFTRTSNCKQEIFKLPILTKMVIRIVIEGRPSQYCLYYKIEQNFIDFHPRSPIPQIQMFPYTIRKFLMITRTSPFLTQIQFKHSLPAYRHGDMQPAVNFKLQADKRLFFLQLTP